MKNKNTGHESHLWICNFDDMHKVYIYKGKDDMFYIRHTGRIWTDGDRIKVEIVNNDVA